MKSVLVTGTDTGVGKTMLCRFLASDLRQKGVNVITQKWVQTGCGQDDDIRDHNLFPLPAWKEVENLDDLRTPYRLKYQASPHLAADREDIRIDIEKIETSYARLCRYFDLVLVEGSGGVLVPLTGEVLLADLAARLSMAAVVVVRNQLGCINHTLLTLEALHARGIPVLGTAFNRMSADGDETILRDNVKTVSLISHIPILGEIPFLEKDADVTGALGDLADVFYQRWKEEG